MPTRIEGFYKTHKYKINVNLPLVEFREDAIQYVYSPALDLFGYGKSEQEARNSFKVVLAEYFRYTTNKKTLLKDLKNHGWIVKTSKTKPVFKLPDWSYLLHNNEQFKEIFDTKNLTKYSQDVTIPVPAYA